jgi:hypothetical protein
MKSSRFLEWELACLRRKRRDVVIVIEQQHHQEPERHSNEYPLGIQAPEVNDPVPRLSRAECASNRYAVDLRVCQSAREPIESDPEERWEGERVVGKYAPDPGFPERATAKLLEAVDGAEV